MRGMLLIGALLVTVPYVFQLPYIGILLYYWLQYVTPTAEYMAPMLPIGYSEALVILTVGSWLAVDRQTILKPKLLIFAFALFIVWINLSTLFAWAPDLAQVKYNRTVKVFLISFFVMVLLTNRTRLEGFIWINVLAVGYYGIQGLGKTVMSGGGGYAVVGADLTFLGERSTFAVALLMIIPMMRYLQLHNTIMPMPKWTKFGLAFGIIACVGSIIGTQARTGLVAGAVVLTLFILKSKRKMAAIVGVAAMVALALAIAPPVWFERMNTIKTYDQDSSSMHRIESWMFAFDVAKKSPLFGGGFRVFTLHLINNQPGKWVDSHSVYFETMGEHGFGGLAIFLTMLVGSYFNCWRTARLCRRQPEELKWAENLASMLSISFAAFAVGGLFLGMATHSMFYDFFAMGMALRLQVERKLEEIKNAAALPPSPAGDGAEASLEPPLPAGPRWGGHIRPASRGTPAILSRPTRPR